MSTILSPSSFIGQFHLPITNDTSIQVQAYLDQHETDYLYKLFGADLYALYLAASATPPVDAPFLVIHNPFVKDVAGSAGMFYIMGAMDHPSYHKKQAPKVRQSYGIVDMLKAFMYFHIQRENVLESTVFGLKKQESEASAPADYAAINKLDEVWNRGIQSFQAIQWYMTSFAPTDYPLYNGECLKTRYLGGAL